MERQIEPSPQVKQTYTAPRLSSLGELSVLTAAGSGAEAESRGRTCRRTSFDQPCA